MKKNDRNLYLSNVSVEEALEIFFEKVHSSFEYMKTEVISVLEGLGRVTATPVFARVSSPNFNASAMDGIAVKAVVTFSASEAEPKQLKLNKDFIYVDTGDSIVDPYDAVIMIEEVVEIDGETVEIMKAAAPWQHIRPIGEDIVAHEMILPSYHAIRPVDIGALLSGGVREIEVVKKPRVGILPTGTEIIEPSEKMELGKIIESNSRVFEGLVSEYGGIAHRYAPTPDDYNLLKKNILKTVSENDMVIINAGSSAGTEDFTVKLVEELGEVYVHGIASKPGKPTILGSIQGKPVIGIPGYPASAYLVFELFAKPLIMRYLGKRVGTRETVEAVLSKRLVSSLKHQEYVRVKLGRVDGKLIATPLNRGAGASMSLVRADGLFILPQNCEGVEAGENIQVELSRSQWDIDGTIVSIGSHDLIMDMIGSILHEESHGYHLSSAHVGSLGGLMALRRGECHIAPIHLLDEETGVYNLPYIKRYLSQQEMSLIKGVKRTQGLMVPKGNPKDIQSFQDLVREDIQFVNRQRGAGTRILLDYELKKRGLSDNQILGYDREMTTHMAVAAAVASGSADVGLGVLSAAQAMDLDFIPVGDEEYDFAIPTRFLKEEMIQQLIHILKSPQFSQSITRLGGYILEQPGTIIVL